MSNSDFKGVCGCIIMIDGKEELAASSGGGGQNTPKIQNYMESCQVDLRMDCPDMFSFDLVIQDQAVSVNLDDLVEGKPIEIKMGPQGKEETVFKGEIHYIEPHFRNEGKSTVTVGGYDKSHRLTRGTSSRTWGDGIQNSPMHTSVVSDVLTKAGGKSGRDSLTSDKTDKPDMDMNYVPQLNASDYMFLKTLGHAADRTVAAATTTDDKKVSFSKLQPGSPVKKLSRQLSAKDKDAVPIGEAHLSLSTVRQYHKVEVHGWDPKTKKPIKGEATAADFKLNGTPGWESTGKALYGNAGDGKVLSIVDRPVDSQKEADALAKAMFQQLSLEFLTGDMDFQGDPKVTPGSLVECLGFGKRFDGQYLVTQVTHIMVPRSQGYRTRVKVASNAIREK
jgi:phage protein D